MKLAEGRNLFLLTKSFIGDSGGNGSSTLISPKFAHGNLVLSLSLLKIMLVQVGHEPHLKFNLTKGEQYLTIKVHLHRPEAVLVYDLPLVSDNMPSPTLESVSSLKARDFKVICP